VLLPDSTNKRGLRSRRLPITWFSSWPAPFLDEMWDPYFRYAMKQPRQGSWMHRLDFPWSLVETILRSL